MTPTRPEDGGRAERGGRVRVLLWAWWPAGCYMGLIWLLSSFPQIELPLQQVPLRDKGVHFVEYAILAGLVMLGFRRSWPELGLVRTAPGALVVSATWGVLDEIHQAFVPGRMPDLLDAVADALGSAFGVAASVAWVWARRARLESSER